MKWGIALAASLFAGAIVLALPAKAETLRLLTWGGYAPDNVIELFEKETGHKVEVTLSNNEEMIAKLRATGGGGFDLAQPSQDRIAGAQAEFDIYKPIDLSKIDASQFIGSMLEATKANTTYDGAVYGVASFIFSPDGRTQPVCGTAPGAYNEIYRPLDFSDSVLAENGTCIPSPTGNESGAPRS